MTHLLDALERGEDIGHYGRLTFAMIAHRFLDRDALLSWLSRDESCDERETTSLVQHVESRDDNPPSRRRILQWQARQTFPICPTPDDPDACTPYTELAMPDAVLEDMEGYWERQSNPEAAGAPLAGQLRRRTQYLGGAQRAVVRGRASQTAQAKTCAPSSTRRGGSTPTRCLCSDVVKGVGQHFPLPPQRPHERRDRDRRPAWERTALRDGARTRSAAPMLGRHPARSLAVRAVARWTHDAVVRARTWSRVFFRVLAGTDRPQQTRRGEIRPNRSERPAPRPRCVIRPPSLAMMAATCLEAVGRATKSLSAISLSACPCASKRSTSTSRRVRPAISRAVASCGAARAESTSASASA